FILLFFSFLMKFLIINSHGKRIHFNNPASGMNRIDIGIIMQNTTDRTDEMSLVIISMKSDEVGAEYPFQNFFPPGKRPENFIRRKGNMKKEPYRNIGWFFLG